MSNKFLYTVLGFAVAFATCCISGEAMAQDKGQKATTDDGSGAARTLQKISEHMSAGEWDGVADLMTDDAWNEWCTSLVVECISVANLDLDMGFAMPGIEDAQDEILETLEKHGLDKIEINQPSIEIRMDAMDEDEESDEETGDEDSEAEGKEQSERILAALDANDNRQDVVQALWQARSASPFTANIFAGKIKDEETGEEMTILTVTPKVSMSGSGDSGVTMQIMVPPVVVNVKKFGENWKYCGVNEEKTAEEMKKFRPKMMGGGDRTDF